MTSQELDALIEKAGNGTITEQEEKLLIAEMNKGAAEVKKILQG